MYRKIFTFLLSCPCCKNKKEIFGLYYNDFVNINANNEIIMWECDQSCVSNIRQV